jgi:glycosyltransferase involved in cell wall biosynthesis
VALVHDWLTGMRGGEKVLDAICELFPGAPLYTLVHAPGSVSPRIEARPIRTSIAQRLPDPGRFYRHYLPLYPIAVELLDLERYDLVISSSHCAVKSVIASGRAVHVCYCHSPMRYAWDQFDAYFGPDQVGPVTSAMIRPVMRRLARWDAATAGRVDRFLANSQYVAGRIRRYYNRGSSIVYPPVDTDYYTPDGRTTSSAFLIVSALVPYKRVDLAIDACRRIGAPLRIVGTGPELARLQAVSGPDVEFLGWRSDEDIRQLYRSSAAVLMPGVEDFGIVPVEAQACGCPVVAFDAGGARETVVPGVTGTLVPEQRSEAFADALAAVLQTRFEPEALRTNALRFSRQQFLTSFTHEVAAALQSANTAGEGRARSPRASADLVRARWPPASQPSAPEGAAGWPPSSQEAVPEGAARWPPSSQEAVPEGAARWPPSSQEAVPEDAARWPPASQQAVREDDQ